MQLVAAQGRSANTAAERQRSTHDRGRAQLRLAALSEQFKGCNVP